MFPVVYDNEPAKVIAPGSYFTDADGFFPGLRLTVNAVPGGWTSFENDSGELHLVGDPDRGTLLLWKDMVAVVTNHRGEDGGQPLAGVGSDREAIVTWLTTLSDVEILDGPEDITVGHGITGTQLTLRTSDTANFGWDDCPENPRCVELLTDPLHWRSNVTVKYQPFTILGEQTLRIFVATIPFDDGPDHTLYVTLVVPKASDLDAFTEAAQPIIDSLTAPDVYVAN
ncbi:MAG: hypothetical protein ABIP53_10525 [Candidatus Limnocylindrales bacterium]